MDATFMEYRDFNLRSIYFMCTGNTPSKEVLNHEGDALWDITLNPESATSIIRYVNEVRNNVQSIRNLVSNELWETVNKNYHFANSFNSEYLKTRGLHEFTHGIQENIYLFNAKLEDTLMHDDFWAFIKIGIYIERIHQVSRSLINTMIDIRSLQNKGQNETIENYQWAILLNTLEATDMTRRMFTSTVQQENTCKFLISNLEFPRSISFCLANFNTLIRKIKNTPFQTNHDVASLEFKGAKIATYLKYLDYNKDVQDMDDLLNHIQEQVIEINEKIHQDFFD